MKIGDLVRDVVGGPVMRVVELIEDGLVAMCRVLSTGVLKRVAVAVLMFAIGCAMAEGHGPEDPPVRNMAHYQQQVQTVATSGQQLTVPPPPRVQVVMPPDEDLVAYYHPHRAWFGRRPGT